MTVLPESPVREYAKRISTLLVDARNEPVAADPAWLSGRRHGFDEARVIVAVEASQPGQETTSFEYRVVAADGAFARETWCESYPEVQQELRALSSTEVFDDLFIERRTVTVTQPVRLGDDGEPVS